MNTASTPRLTPNQIKLRAAGFAADIVEGASQRNIDAIADYGDCLRDPHYPTKRVPRKIEAQFYRALAAAANAELMAFASDLLDDEDRLSLLENEIARLVSTLTEDARQAQGKRVQL